MSEVTYHQGASPN